MRERSSIKSFDCNSKLLEDCELPTVARYIVDCQNPPGLTDTVQFAERIHAALVSLSSGSPVFTGCDGSGKPLLGHMHTHIFCESNCAFGRGDSGEITEITVFAPIGFGQRERTALSSLREIFRPCDGAIRLILHGIGKEEEFGGLDLAREESPLFAKARTWVSRTPFIPTRHPKVTRAGVPKVDASGIQIGSPEHELRRLLLLAGYPEPTAIEPVMGTMLGGREVPWDSFRLVRGSGGGKRAAYGRGYGFRIRFPVAVRGPVALGYGAHFGMGGFVGVMGSACINP